MIVLNLYNKNVQNIKRTRIKYLKNIKLYYIILL